MNICPICGVEYSEHPALSRKNNNVLICLTCGLREALLAAGVSKAEADEVLSFIKDKMNTKE